MRFFMFILFVSLVSCEPPTSAAERGEAKQREDSTSEYVSKIAPLIDPAKLLTLKGKRAATPRLRKACYWLAMAKGGGCDLAAVILQAHAATGHDSAAREAEQATALIRNMTILERLGCLDHDGMDKLRRGRAPTITRGPYAGQLATGDHVIPRSIAPELDNALFNLEFMPEKLNQSKGNKVTERQVQLAERYRKTGLLSEKGLQAVIKAYSDNSP